MTPLQRQFVTLDVKPVVRLQSINKNQTNFFSANLSQLNSQARILTL